MIAIHLVFGPQGAGKTTYSRQLALEENAVRFSLDEWMGALYGPDLPVPLDLGWVLDRVGRCRSRIWSVALELAARQGCAVLDLGLQTAHDRAHWLALAHDAGLSAQLHYVTAPLDLRRERVANRNMANDGSRPFEVTPAMFDFMEGRFEPATEDELAKSRLLQTG